MSQNHILVLHGPNLNLLGEREPQIYGHQSLQELNQALRQIAKKHSVKLSIHQSNHEGKLIDWIHTYRKHIKGLLINPAGYTHTSVALGDAVALLLCPVVEVHLSDINAREPFRQHSFIKAHALKQISGHGIQSYVMGLELLIRTMKSKSIKQSKRKQKNNVR